MAPKEDLTSSGEQEQNAANGDHQFGLQGNSGESLVVGREAAGVEVRQTIGKYGEDHIPPRGVPPLQPTKTGTANCGTHRLVSLHNGLA